MSNTISINEKQNKRKGMTYSVVFNTIIVLLALYPFLTMDPPEPEQPKFVEVQFTDFKSSSKKSAEGDKKEEEAPEKKVAEEVKEEVVEEPTPEPEVKEVKPEPKPEPVPQRAPVVTTTKPNPPVRTSPTKPKKKMRVPPIRNKPDVTKPEPKPKKPAKTKTKKTNTKAKTKKTKSTGKTSSKKQEGKNTKSNSGGGEAAENGTDATKGKTDSGTKVGDFPGDGLFNRKVIYRADVKSVTKEEGKIVIDLCVNRDGRVVYSKFNKGASSIKTMSVIRKAMDIAQQYRFEKDYTAPDKQCGKLTFIFEIEEE